MQDDLNIHAWLSHFGDRPDTSKGTAELSEEGVRMRCPDGHVEEMSWSALRKVTVLTTDLGPVIDDVFFVLEAHQARCIVPQESAGSAVLLKRLQELPGFDNAKFIAAMCSTECATFICWEAT